MSNSPPGAGRVALALERHTTRVGADTPGAAGLAFVFEGASPYVTLAGERTTTS